MNGYFISGSKCLQCDPTCLTCNGASATSCLSCESGSSLNNSTCVKDELINNTVTSAAKLTGFAMQAQSIATSVLPAVTGGVSTSAMLLVGFLADVDIYKYINVDFPENFVSFCRQMEETSLPNIFQNLDTENEGDNPSSTIGKFQFWDVSTTLLDNSSVAIFKNLATLGVILVLNILVPIFKGYPRLHGLLNKIRRLFMWNIFLSYFLGDFSELLLNSMIQLRENYVSSAYANLSFAFAVLIVIAYPLLFVYLVYKLNKKYPLQMNAERGRAYRSSPRINHKSPKWAEIPASIGIVVEDFRENNSFTRNFQLILMLESFLQILVVFFPQENRLAQAVIYTIIVVVYTLLSVWHLQMAILLINLISKAIMGIMTIVFGSNDIARSISQASLDRMGLTLIVLILLVIGANFLISVVLIIISLYEWIKEWIARHKKKTLKPHTNNTRITVTRNNFISEQHPSRPADISLDHHNLSNSQLFENTSTTDKSPSTINVLPNGRFIDVPRLRIVSKKNRWDISKRSPIKDHLS